MPYQILRPEMALSGVVFASPHSGRCYPKELSKLSVLDERTIRSSEDAFMDQLIEDAPRLGAPLLLALTPRAYVDLNRGADELDPALVEGVRKLAHNPRITSGLGVIPRVVANGRPIYGRKISRARAQRRLDEHWEPYHSALQALLNEQRAKFGKVVLVDWHSMPHEAVEGFTLDSGHRPDVVLGDRFGASADPAIVDAIAAAFAAEGLRAARNTPFAGAYVTKFYGRPSQNQHAVQIEIDRALYMDEGRIEPNANFDSVREMLSRVMQRIMQIGQAEVPLAAE